MSSSSSMANTKVESMDTTKLELKLMIDKEKKRVLFAECDKYFVDTLFSILTVPMGVLVRLADKKSNVGCMDTLYTSIENMDSRYLITEATKDMLLRPRSAAETLTRNLKIDLDSHPRLKLRMNFICPLFQCPCIYSFSIVPKTKCYCGRLRDKRIYDKSSGVGDVFVEGNGRYIVGDDLHVFPASTTTCIALLNKLGYGHDKAALALEEKIVHVGAVEVWNLFLQSVFSATPLTTLFLRVSNALGDLNSSPANIIPIMKKCSNGDETMSMSIFLNKSLNKVVYAELTDSLLGKLFNFVLVPIGYILKLFGRSSTALGCLHNVYKSVEDLSGHGHIFKHHTAMLLEPKMAFRSLSWPQPPHLKFETLAPPAVTYVCCSQCYTRNPLPESCTHGGSSSNLNCADTVYVLPTTIGVELVKAEKLKFIVTDDLDVKPFSTVTMFSLLHKLNEPISDLQERVVSVGEEEVMSLLKASVCSKSVLTDVFCQKELNQPKIKVEPN